MFHVQKDSSAFRCKNNRFWNRYCRQVYSQNHIHSIPPVVSIYCKCSNPCFGACFMFYWSIFSSLKHTWYSPERGANFSFRFISIIVKIPIQVGQSPKQSTAYSLLQWPRVMHWQRTKHEMSQIKMHFIHSFTQSSMEGGGENE